MKVFFDNSFVLALSVHWFSEWFPLHLTWRGRFFVSRRKPPFASLSPILGRPNGEHPVIRSSFAPRIFYLWEAWLFPWKCGCVEPPFSWSGEEQSLLMELFHETPYIKTSYTGPLSCGGLTLNYIHLLLIGQTLPFMSVKQQSSFRTMIPRGKNQHYVRLYRLCSRSSANKK